MKKWEYFKTKAIQLFGGLLMEKDSDSGLFVISLGKTAFLACFGCAMYIWIVGKGNGVKDISPNHLTVLMSLLTYNFGKKAVSTFQAVWGNKAPITTTTTVKSSSADGPG